MSNLKPVVKWVGGKSLIYDRFKKLFDYSNCKRFYDLFCGSLSLHINNKKLPNKIYFNDINKWLINTFEIIKKYPDELIKLLKEYNTEEYNNKEKFCEIRKEYNEYKMKSKLSKDKKIKMATIFIYLNKRSFNGIYRENSSGKYNVPYRENKSNIFCEINIRNWNKFLKDTKIIFSNKSYLEFNKFRKGDLVYSDPPYYPSKKSQFTSYWKLPFKIKEQEELCNYLKKLDEKGIKWIMSNSPCDEIKDLYKDFHQESFYIGRQMRSAKGKSDVYEKKYEDNEILITNIYKN